MIKSFFDGFLSGAERASGDLISRPSIFFPNMSVDTTGRVPNLISSNQVNEKTKTSRSLMNRVCCLFLLVILPTSLCYLLTANKVLTAAIAIIALIVAFYVNKKL